MLIRSYEGSKEPRTPEAVLASKPPVIMPQQFFELDEVLIEGALYDKEDIQRSVRFDRTAALSSIQSIGARSDECGPDAVGTVNVLVTFAPSGEATTAEVEDGPLRGAQAGSCVARRLRNARVAEFDGDRETVRTSIVLR